MKSKRLIIVFCAVLLCLGLVACKKDNVEKPSSEVLETNDSNISGEVTESVETFEDGYFEFVKQFTEEIQDFIPILHGIERYFVAGEDANPVDYGVSSLLASINRSEDYFSKMSYLLKDLNGDGIQEFLLYYDSEELKNIIITMYSYQGEYCHCILNSQDFMKFTLCENDIIKVEYEGEENIDFTKLDNELRLEVVDYIDAETSEVDANAILNKYKAVELDLKKVK